MYTHNTQILIKTISLNTNLQITRRCQLQVHILIINKVITSIAFRIDDSFYTGYVKKKLQHKS